MTLLLYYLIFINLIAFFIFLFDKIRAIDHGWRLPEWGLLFLCLLGGSLGGLMAIQIFRHKRRKSGFVIIMLVILILQIIFGFYLISRYQLLANI